MNVLFTNRAEAGVAAANKSTKCDGNNVTNAKDEKRHKVEGVLDAKRPCPILHALTVLHVGPV